jgi:hypothetical protein
MMGVRSAVLAAILGAVALRPSACGGRDLSAPEVVAKARAALPRSGVAWIQITVTSPTGVSRTRTVERRFQRGEDELRTWIRALAPIDVAGVELLLLDRAGRVDEMSLYLPAFKRVNTVSGSSRGLGSALVYEDLEVLEGLSSDPARVVVRPDAWVVDAFPPLHSAYTRVRTTYRRHDLLAERVELYDAEGRAKVIEVLRSERRGGYVLPVDVQISQRDGSETRLEVLQAWLDVPVSDETFTRAFLERER